MTVIEWLQTGVGVIIDSAILMAIIPISSVVLTLNSSNARSQQVSKQIEKYTEFNQYDGTHVKAQDITAVILAYRGFPAVKLERPDISATYVWSTTIKATPFTAKDINDRLDPNAVYDSDIEINPNGEIVSVRFRRCNGGCGR